MKKNTVDGRQVLNILEEMLRIKERRIFVGCTGAN